MSPTDAALGEQALQIGLGLEMCRALGKSAVVPPALATFCLSPSRSATACMNQRHEAIEVKIHIGQGGKSGLDRKNIDLLIGKAHLAALHRHLGQAH